MLARLIYRSIALKSNLKPTVRVISPVSAKTTGVQRLSENIQSLSEKSKKEKTDIISRMLKMVSGQLLFVPKTRTDLLVYYVVLVIMAGLYWYWVIQVRKYGNYTLLERGILEYDEKGKLVDTKAFKEALNVSPVVIATVTMRLRQRISELDKEVQEFMEERIWVKEVLEKQKEIDAKLESLERKLDSKL